MTTLIPRFFDEYFFWIALLRANLMLEYTFE